MTDLRDIKDRSPNPALIKHLESMLKDAKSGNIRSIVSIVEWDDRDTTHSWILDGRAQRKLILAELTMLQHDFTVNLEFLEEDSVLCQALE